jgi:diguanylate cyclase (GGDEF)-like protein
MKIQLTVFKKLLIAFLGVGIVAVFCSAVSHYELSRTWVEKDVKGQVAHSFGKAIGYFEEFYSQTISNDLELITTTPLLNNFLMSENNEVYLTQPNAEKLFLHFTKSVGTKYLSARFINSQGKEEIVVEGNRRIHQYTSILSHPPGEFYDRLYSLFKRLEHMPAGLMLFEGPFADNNKTTFLIGVPKRDPEAGGFGGAVIFHCDLTPYFRYLSTIKFRGASIASVYSVDRKKLLYSGNSEEPFTVALEDDTKDDAAQWYSFEHGMNVGKGGAVLFHLIMRIPQVLFVKELQMTLMHSIWISLLILGSVMISAFFVAHNITRPIKRLVNTTQRVSAGDLTTKAEIFSDDEIGQLSRSFNEMMDSLRQSEERLQYEAFHDVLTALPNRSLLLDRLERLIERNRRHHEHRFAVLFVDLDRFKNVNDSLGHAKGDELLVAISHRLQMCLRTMDTVARLGGDEFIILMDEIADVSDATELADRILNALKPVFLIAAQEIYISASIGIVLSNPTANQPADYLRDTDTAMYRAKALGKARYQVFDTTMHKNAMASLQMEAELRNALERQEFVIFYQPIVSLATKKIVRLEALMRWHHPRRGLVTPTEFIPLAEEAGLISTIGNWVVGTVCQQVKLWRDQGRSVVPVAVNFSAKQFEQKNFVATIKNFLKESQGDGNMLAVEITESIAMKDVSLSIAVLNEFRSMGIKISIDDFGIGYSSLNSLKLFPIDELKIDRSFIHDIIENPDKAAIVKAIIVMAHSLGYSVTGEGIETQAQLDFLTRYGCDAGQGFLFSKAVSAEDIQARLG